MKIRELKRECIRKIRKKKKKWLGYQDSNLGMPGSKPGALPLGDTPTTKEMVATTGFEPVTPTL